MFKKSLMFTAVAALAALSAGKAEAAGYQLNDYSVTGLGRSYAGAGVAGDDYSALAYNPAAMFSNPKSGMQAGITVVQQRGTVKGTGSFPGERGKDLIRVYSPLPNFLTQMAVNDKFMLGFGVYTPYGLASDYGDDFFATTEGITTDLRIFDTNLSAAYKITDTLSFGASLIYRYVRGKVTGQVKPAAGFLNEYEYDLDNWDWYGNYGFMWEPEKDTRFGISYRPTRHHKVTGKLMIEGNFPLLVGTYDASSTQILPEQMILSAFTKKGDFGYSFTARWSRWSRFKKFSLYAPAAPGAFAARSVPYQWKDTWTFAVGTDWYYNEKWTYRAGLSYDKSPATNGLFRTTRIPDQSRYWASLGFTYNFDKKSRIDVAYAHLFMRTYRAHNGAAGGPGTADIKYDAQANILGVQYQYDF